MPDREQLGFVTCPSGVLIVIDTGYLLIWSHDQPPMLPDGVLETMGAKAAANSFVDLRVVGADAEQAGRMLAMSWHPLFIYDQPPDHPELDKKLSDLVSKHDLNARFDVDIPEDLAYGRGVEVEEYKQRHALKLGTDFRPHSHYWRVMEPTRSSPTESGMAEVGEATVCNFMTSWGDGLFDVYRDVGQSGSLVQIRIEFCETSTASAR